MESSNQKTLSNSTLSLRFMQNAHRMKQQATVQAAQAKVKDDAEWEVPKHVREAWGLRSSEIEPEPSVFYEASYMPFLFPSSNSDNHSSDEEVHHARSSSSLISQQMIRGRRKFETGKEVPIQQSSTAIDDAADGGKFEPTSQINVTSGGRKKGHSSALSSKKANALRLKDEQSSKLVPQTITSDSSTQYKGHVLDMISKESVHSVGVDLRQPQRSKQQTHPVSAEVTERRHAKDSTSFLRPAGVDSPAPAQRREHAKRKKHGDGSAEEERASEFTGRLSDDGDSKGPGPAKKLRR